jgi:hypothetical protein
MIWKQQHMLVAVAPMLLRYQYQLLSHYASPQQQQQQQFIVVVHPQSKNNTSLVKASNALGLQDLFLLW